MTRHVSKPPYGCIKIGIESRSHKASEETRRESNTVEPKGLKQKRGTRLGIIALPHLKGGDRAATVRLCCIGSHVLFLDISIETSNSANHTTINSVNVDSCASHGLPVGYLRCKLRFTTISLLNEQHDMRCARTCYSIIISRFAHDRVNIQTLPVILGPNVAMTGPIVDVH